MASPITKRLRAAIEIVQQALVPAALAHYGIADKKSVEKVVSDAASSREAEYMMADLGSSGKLGEKKISLAGKLPKDWQSISRGWQVAVNIDVVAQALEKSGWVAPLEGEADEDGPETPLAASQASPAAKSNTP